MVWYRHFRAHAHSFFFDHLLDEWHYDICLGAHANNNVSIFCELVSVYENKGNIKPDVLWIDLSIVSLACDQCNAVFQVQRCCFFTNNIKIMKISQVFNIFKKRKIHNLNVQEKAKSVTYQYFAAITGNARRHHNGFKSFFIEDFFIFLNQWTCWQYVKASALVGHVLLSICWCQTILRYQQVRLIWMKLHGSHHWYVSVALLAMLFLDTSRINLVEKYHYY